MRDWKSVPPWESIVDPFVLGRALLRHVDSHIGNLQILNVGVSDGQTPTESAMWDIEARMEAKHAVDDIMAALDYCAFYIYKSHDIGHPRSEREDRRVHFPFPGKNDCGDPETEAEFLKRGDDWRTPQLFRQTAPFFFSGKYPDISWIGYLREVGNSSKHRQLWPTHVGKVGYGFEGTDMSLIYALTSAHRTAVAILEQTDPATAGAI